MPTKKRNCGVYMIRNLKNGHSYIGASYDLEARMQAHHCAIFVAKSTKPPYRDAFVGVTEADVEFRILEFLKPRKSRGWTNTPINARERFWIVKLQPTLNTRLKIARTEIVPSLPVGPPPCELSESAMSA